MVDLGAGQGAPTSTESGAVNRVIRASSIALAAVLLVVAGVSMPATAVAKSDPIGPANFGMHSFWQNPKVPHGPFRLNCAPGWDEIQPINEPNPAKWNWALMDYWVRKVRSWGYRDITYTFCRTPKWATPRGQNARTSSEWYLYNPNVTDEVPILGHYRFYIRQVIKRYGWAFSGYEPINEANMPGFFAGTPEQAADLTSVLHSAVRTLDPTARVLSASWVVLGSETEVWKQIRLDSFSRYLRALRARGSRFDVLALHHYSSSSAAREDIMVRTAAVIAANGYAAKPKWDTEFNMRDNGASATRPTGHYSDRDGAGELVKAFVRGLRQGYQRQYWYAWSSIYDDFTGIQMGGGMTDRSSNAALAFQRTFDSLRGATLQRCGDAVWRTTITACRFYAPKARKGFWVAWTRDRTVRNITMPRGSVWSTFNLTETGGATSRGSITVTRWPRVFAEH